MSAARVRFDSLDAVRGLGALAVVLWHWQHMLLVSGPRFLWPPAGGADHRTEPLYALWRTFYDYGFRAVDLFFVISGFVFYLLYEESIAQKRTPGGQFFILRLSRLYPLHFLTLLIVAITQYFFWTHTHQTFVYGNNTPANFVWNLFLINAPDYSFNGPTWALTVEALLYLMFWPLARVGVLKGWIVTALLFGLGIFLLLPAEVSHVAGLSVWGRGIAGFFAGGIACRLYQFARGKAAWASATAFLATAGWALTLWLVYAQPKLSGDQVTQLALTWSLFYGLFPVTIIALALWDERRAKPIPLFAWLGTISYSAYVIHFPMQLLIALAIVNGFGPVGIAHSLIAQIAFFALLLVLARLVNRTLEEPLQHWLRRAVAPKPAT